MYEIQIIKPAEDDITEIYTYIKYQLHAPESAEKFRKGIWRTVDTLKENPNRGASYFRGTRKIFYKQYKIIYKVNDQIIKIIAVTK